MSLPKTYKSVVIDEAGGDWAIKDVELKQPGEGEILVKVSHCGVCHSDSGAQAGHFGPMVNWPLVPGHEFIGEIVAVGKGSETRWQQGQRVGGPWAGGHDGTCNTCAKGYFQMCDNAAVNGVTRAGGYAEYVNMRSESAVRIPDGMDLAECAPLLCAGVTVFNGIRQMRVMPGSVVAVQGLGGLGHLAVQYSRKMGYKTVAISSSADKKDFATKLGAHHYIDTSSQDVAEELQKMGGASLIVATAPNPKAIAGLVGGCGPLGKLLILAAAGEVSVNSIALIGKGISVRGWPSGHARDCEEAIEFAQTHDVRCMVEKFKFSDVKAAVDKMINNEVRFRSVLVMDQ